MQAVLPQICRLLPRGGGLRRGPLWHMATPELAGRRDFMAPFPAFPHRGKGLWPQVDHLLPPWGRIKEVPGLQAHGRQADTSQLLIILSAGVSTDADPTQGHAVLVIHSHSTLPRSHIRVPRPLADGQPPLL